MMAWGKAPASAEATNAMGVTVFAPGFFQASHAGRLQGIATLCLRPETAARALRLVAQVPAGLSDCPGRLFRFRIAALEGED
jgi:hypothetical protein